MHFSRRNEAFRYEFPGPLNGEFRISKVNGAEVDSNPGKLQIINISLSGARISTSFDFQADDHDVELILHFRIMDSDFSIYGKVLYQRRIGDQYSCGLHLLTDEHIQERLVKELKAFAWELVERKRG